MHPTIKLISVFVAVTVNSCVAFGQLNIDNLESKTANSLRTSLLDDISELRMQYEQQLEELKSQHEAKLNTALKVR